jgi:deoxycytidine triphosphate deaminase
MQLTGKQIIEKGIITNYCEEGVQQQGIDVRLKSIRTMLNKGKVPAQGKTILPLYYKQEFGEDDCIELSPGYYEVEFEEAREIPNNMVLNYKTRSSLVRCGAIIHSGQFDAGFKTQNMGVFLHVIRPIILEKGARLAQAIVTESYPVDDENLYDGQWQNDKQRS